MHRSDYYLLIFHSLFKLASDHAIYSLLTYNGALICGGNKVLRGWNWADLLSKVCIKRRTDDLVSADLFLPTRNQCDSSNKRVYAVTLNWHTHSKLWSRCYYNDRAHCYPSNSMRAEKLIKRLAQYFSHTNAVRPLYWLLIVLQSCDCGWWWFTYISIMFLSFIVISCIFQSPKLSWTLKIPSE